MEKIITELNRVMGLRFKIKHVKLLTYDVWRQYKEMGCRTYKIKNKYKYLGHGKNNIYVVKGAKDKYNELNFSEYRIITVQWLIEASGELDIYTYTLYLFYSGLLLFFNSHLKLET